MTTIFRTNINCVKHFMNNISGLNLDPKINDNVEIYRDSDCKIVMTIISRTWTFTNGSQPVLVCQLDVPSNFQSISEFEKYVESLWF